MLLLDVTTQQAANQSAGVEQKMLGPARSDGTTETLDRCVPAISETISYFLEKEGDAIHRLHGNAVKLGLAVMLCDERGRLFAIREPAKKLECGGIPPRALRRVRDYIERNLDKSLHLDELARVTGLSRCHFVRAFKQSVGTTPHYYLLKKRTEHASALLRETDIPLAEIALQCGFSDQSHLSRSFRTFFESTPRAFRRRHR